jgi:hypothetical protein
MSLVSDKARFVMPEAYFGCSHGHIPELKLESSSVGA